MSAAVSQLRQTLQQRWDRAAHVPEAPEATDFREELFVIKRRIHRSILASADLDALNALPVEAQRAELGERADRFLRQANISVNQPEREWIRQAVRSEILGLGPIDALLEDPTVSDILVNGPAMIYVERAGRLQRSRLHFEDDAHLLRIIGRIVSRVGRRIDESNPMVDARLADGSRVNAIIAPLALDGPVLSIRRFSVTPYSMQDLIAFGTLDPALAKVLTALVAGRANILISGGTGSGKTTLLNVMSTAIAADQRIITIEDAAELQLRQTHVVRLETRSANIEGQGEVSQRELLRNALRMRPDRIVVGEVRGHEVIDMLQAMNTGHEGSMTTVHANSPLDAVTRLEHMLEMAGMPASPSILRRQIASALTVVVQISRLSDGSRRVTSLMELDGADGTEYRTSEIFKFEQHGVEVDGAVRGRIQATGARPLFVERLRSRGIELPDSLFIHTGTGLDAEP